MCLFCFLPIWPPPRATLFPYTTLFRSVVAIGAGQPLTNFEGAQPKEALQQWVDALVEQIGLKLKGLDAQDMPQEAETQEGAEDPRLAEAESKLNQSDFDGAMAVYDSISAEE